MKAYFVAVAFIASLAPAAAGEAGSSGSLLRVGETQVSRIYRIRWLKAYMRTHDRNSQITKTASARAKTFVFSLDDTRADAKSIAAKVRKIVARAEANLLPALDRPYIIKRRLRVSCKTRYLVAARNRPSAGFPALMEAVLADQQAEPEQVVLKSKKICTVHYRMTRKLVTQTDGKQDFEITLPDLQAVGAQPRPAPIE